MRGGELINGVREVFAADGALIYRAPFVDGQPHGLVRRWYLDGRLKAESLYDAGVEDGWRVEYHHENQVASSGRMVAGRPDGVWFYWVDERVAITEFCQGAALRRVTQIDYNEVTVGWLLEDSRRHGLWIKWNRETGVPVSVTQWQLGEKVCEWEPGPDVPFRERIFDDW